tara:strand:- start:492 stop:1247 length:756 start_codon:yes stop_codon:yes gene_type:complete
MCIAILKPANKSVKKKNLRESFLNNKDGAGYMYSKDGILNIYKGFFTFDDFWKSYRENVVNNGNPITAIHFRITTHGLVNRTNCHPFRISQNLGVIHNGIISDVDDHAKKSDTWMFNETILKTLPEGFIYNPSIMKLIEGFIDNSKLVFLDHNGDYAIANEKKGHWNKDVWYSNRSYECDTFGFSKNVFSYGYYTNNGNLNKRSTNFRKPKKAFREVSYFQCRGCQGSLTTALETSTGYCNDCDKNMLYSG